jgi:DNA repair exonuclease SbcCD ATPase subunit
MSRYASAAAVHDDAFMRFDDNDAPNFLIEDADSEYRRTKEELERLKQRQEEVEQKRRELELLETKRHRYNLGRREILDRLSRAAGSVDHHLEDMQLLTKELNLASTAFASALEQLQALNTDSCRARAEELDEAIHVVEEAESVYAKTCRRLTSLRPDIFEEAELEFSRSGAQNASSSSMRTWLYRGSAFALPMTLGLAMLLLFAKWLFKL